MLVFIDESGDPGLKPDSGSSDYFIVTLVVFEDNDEALAADHRIERLKKELGFRPEFEFKFNKLKGAFRESFLSAVAGFTWFYLSIVINKRNLAQMKMAPALSFRNAHHTVTVRAEAVSKATVTRRAGISTPNRTRSNPTDRVFAGYMMGGAEVRDAVAMHSGESPVNRGNGVFDGYLTKSR